MAAGVGSRKGCELARIMVRTCLLTASGSGKVSLGKVDKEKKLRMNLMISCVKLMLDSSMSYRHCAANASLATCMTPSLSTVTSMSVCKEHEHQQ